MPKTMFMLCCAIASMMVCIVCSARTEIAGSGMIEIEEVEISSKIAGQVNEIRVDEGTNVNAGDTLVILDHREILAQKNQAQAGLVIAEQTLREIETRKKELQKNLERIESVYKEGAVSDQDMEDIRTQVEVLNAEHDKAVAGLQQAQAKLDLAQTQLGYACMTSPVAGVVLSKNFETGENAFPGSIILKIGNIQTAWLKIYVPERDIGRIALGAPAHVFVDAYPRETFAGEVTWISSKAEFTPRNIQTKDDRAQLVFAVKITLSNEERKLLPGMPADAKILEHERR